MLESNESGHRNRATIGSVQRLLSLRQLQSNKAIRAHPLSRKPLTLLVALVLCLFAFTLVSIGEAQAQERLSQAAQRPTANGEAERPAILDGKGADQVGVQRSLVDTSLVETESIETTMTDASPPG